MSPQDLDGEPLRLGVAMNKDATAELHRLQKQAPSGLLRPEAVVEHAADESSALHRYFTWDDGEAAQAYRLLQARQLIRVAVTVLESTSDRVRAFVSLTSDRKVDGGYRAMVDVLDDPTLLDQMLADAKAELSAFTRKYRMLREAGELSGVFEAITSAEVVEAPAKRRNRNQRAAA